MENIISNFGNYYDKGIDKVIDEATESNYDFCDTDVEIFNVLVTSGADFDLTAKAIKDVTGKDGEIVPKDNNTTHFIIFNSNQIKSATDNIGTYSENPDIRWKIDDDEALERIRKLSAADIEGIMDEAERVVSDNLKESKGRSAATVEADREKYIRDNMSKWKEGGEEEEGGVR